MKNYFFALVTTMVLAATPCFARTFAAPHVFEQKGRMASSDADINIDAIYAGGLASELKDQGEVSLNLFLYSGEGNAFLRDGRGGNVCAPCTVTLSAKKRKVTIPVSQIIARKMGRQPVPASAFAVIETKGEGSDSVALQGYIVNSHATPGVEVSAFGFNPIEITSTK